jgi:hypothetical protein
MTRRSHSVGHTSFTIAACRCVALTMLLLASMGQTPALAQRAIPPTITQSLAQSAAQQTNGLRTTQRPSQTSSAITSPTKSNDSTVADSTVAVGQPGLNFRYERTFGVTEQAYPGDGTHINTTTTLHITTTL